MERREELEQRNSNDNTIKDKRKYTYEDLESIVLEMVRIKNIAKGVQNETDAFPVLMGYQKFRAHTSIMLSSWPICYFQYFTVS